MVDSPRTRILTDEELSTRLREGCPACHQPLKFYARSVYDEKLEKHKSGGGFYGCSKFGKTCMAKYHVSVETNRESII